MTIELKKLKCFVTVATLKNFTAAAKALNTVQPAISRQIADLESALNATLLIRNTREVKLTEAGHYLLHHAQRMFELEQDIVTNVRRIDRGEIGQLRIGFLASASFSFIGELVKQYTTEFPNVNVRLIELTSQEQIDAFDRQEIDIGFSRPIPNNMNKNIGCETIYDDHLVAIVPDSHPLAQKKTIALQQLKSENFILLSQFKAVGLFNKINGLLHKAKITPRIVSQPQNMQSLLTEVSANLGVSIAPSCIQKLYAVGCKFIPLNDAINTKVPLEIHYLAQNPRKIVEAFVTLALAYRPQIQH